MSPELDPFTHTLNRFCSGLSEKLATLETEDVRDPGVQLIVGELLNCIRESMANLMLCELECERILHHE